MHKVVCKERRFANQIGSDLEGFVKINVDGCSKANPVEAGADEVFRNEEGIWIMGFFNKFGHVFLM